MIRSDRSKFFFSAIAQEETLKRVLPFALFMLVLAIRGFVADSASVTDGLDARWLYLLQALLPLAALAAFLSAYSELRTPPRQISSSVISIAVGIGVFLLWIAPMPRWAQLGNATAPFQPVSGAGDLIWGLIGIRTFGAVLVVPLMEELFWRSFLLRWIDRRDFLAVSPAQTSWFALIASSAVFATAHNLWLAGFAAGLVYGLLYRRLGNLWYAVLAHATTNLALAVWVVSQRSWSYW